MLILGIGTTLGVMLQALILLPVMWRSGYAWRPRFDWRGAGLGKAGSLAAWTIGLVLVNQVAYVFITRLAERLGHLGSQLSGGEQQMLSIGRALLTNPSLIILDWTLPVLGAKEVLDVLRDHLGLTGAHLGCEPTRLDGCKAFLGDDARILLGQFTDGCLRILVPLGDVRAELIGGIRSG